MILEILAFSSCDRSKGDPGEVGPIKFRIHDRDDHPLYVVTVALDLPGALRILADVLEDAPYLRFINAEDLPEVVTSHTVSPETLEKLETMATTKDPAELERMAALVDLDPFR